MRLVDVELARAGLARVAAALAVKASGDLRARRWRLRITLRGITRRAAMSRYGLPPFTRAARSGSAGRALLSSPALSASAWINRAGSGAG